MASEGLHENLDDLSAEALDMHRALVSLGEELEAVDWYGQRAEASEDDALKAILLHNLNEEIEHASMLIEWLRRNHSGFRDHLKDYLFTSAPITELESDSDSEDAEAETVEAPTQAAPEIATTSGFTIGSLKE
jgi:hypothetical protein